MTAKSLSNIGTAFLEKVANVDTAYNTNPRRVEQKRTPVDANELIKSIEEKVDESSPRYDNMGIDKRGVDKQIKALRGLGYKAAADSLALKSARKTLTSRYSSNSTPSIDEIDQLNYYIDRFNQNKHISQLSEKELEEHLHNEHNPELNHYRFDFDDNGKPISYVRDVKHAKVLSQEEQQNPFGEHRVNNVDFSEKDTIFGYHPENIQAMENYNYMKALKDIHKNHIGTVRQFGNNHALTKKYLAKKYLFIKNKPSGVSNDDLRKVLGNDAVVDAKHSSVPMLDPAFTQEINPGYKQMSKDQFNGILGALKTHATEVIRDKGANSTEGITARRAFAKAINSAPESWYLNSSDPKEPISIKSQNKLDVKIKEPASAPTKKIIPRVDGVPIHPEDLPKEPTPTIKEPTPTIKEPTPTIKEPKPTIKEPKPTIKEPKPIPGKDTPIEINFGDEDFKEKAPINNHVNTNQVNKFKSSKGTESIAKSKNFGGLFDKFKSSLKRIGSSLHF